VTALNQDPEFALTQAQLKEYLETAVYPAKNLRDVQLREMEAIVSQGQLPFSYDQYFLCLTAAAQLHDGSMSRRLPPRSARINQVALDLEPDLDTDQHQDSDADLLVNQVKSDRPRLPASTWDKLSKAARSSWNTFSDTDKATMIDTLAQPNQRSINAIHQSDHHTGTDHDSPTFDDSSGAADLSVSAANFRSQPSKTVTIADAHPGDVRRLLSTRNTTKGTTTTVKQLQTSSATTNPSGQCDPQPGGSSADIQTRSTRVDFQQHTPPIPRHGPDPSTRPPVGVTPTPAEANAHQTSEPAASTPFLKISTARVDKAIDDYWASDNAQVNDDQDFW
jgi:hypothetical protein